MRLYPVEQCNKKRSAYLPTFFVPIFIIHTYTISTFHTPRKILTMGESIMDFLTVLNQLLILFILLLIGYVGRKLNVFDGKVTKGLASILIKISLPALIISSMQSPFSSELLAQSGQILAFSFLVYGGSFLLALWIPKLLRANPDEVGVFRFIIMFSNVGFMGYPVLEVIFGPEALFYGAIYNLPFNFLIFTVGIILLRAGRREQDSMNWKIFINPGAIAVCIGFILFTFSLHLPEAVAGAVDMMGSTTTPLSMIIVGALLFNIRVRQIFGNWRIYVVCAVRLFIIPLIVFLILRLFYNDTLMIGVPVIIAAMPAAANTAILAEEYKANGELASQGVFISTLVSIISIPIVSLWIR